MDTGPGSWQRSRSGLRQIRANYASRDSTTLRPCIPSSEAKGTRGWGRFDTQAQPAHPEHSWRDFNSRQSSAARVWSLTGQLQDSQSGGLRPDRTIRADVGLPASLKGRLSICAGPSSQNMLRGPMMDVTAEVGIERDAAGGWNAAAPTSRCFGTFIELFLTSNRKAPDTPTSARFLGPADNSPLLVWEVGSSRRSDLPCATPAQESENFIEIHIAP